jgi:glycosyltransferase involved in cell wall biosynthesis
MKVCMLVTNPVSNDPRVRREAATLVKAGYQVVVIGVQGKESGPEEWLDGYRVVRVPLPRFLHRNLRHLIHYFLLWLKTVAPRLYAVLRDRYRSVNPRKPVEAPLASPPLPERSALRSDLLNVIHVLRINLKMAGEAIKQHADVYHAHDLDTLLAGYMAKLRTRKKLVYDFHELYTEQFKEGIKTGPWRFYYYSLEWFLVKRTELRLTVCESLGDWVTQRYGTDGVITVRNVPVYESPPQGQADLEREPMILYHGGYFRDRGLEQLIESAQYLERGRIVFRGFGELEDHLRALVREQGLEDRVSFVPPVPMPELVKTAAEADIGVIPYIPFCLNNRFCLPNKIFEYLMAGLAVVGSDLPELRKVVMGHNVGLVFNPEDPQDIARALNELLVDRARLEAMKRNALLAARTVYNWEAESPKLLKAYESLVAASAPR